MSLDFDLWRKEHKSMDPSCLVSMVQAGGGGVIVWGIFSWHTLGPLIPIEHCLNTTANLSIVGDHVHPFMTTVYPSSDATSSSILHHVTKLKSSQTGFLRTKDLNYFSLCAFNLFNTRVSQFELNYWNKLIFHDILIYWDATIYIYIYIYIYHNNII